MTKVIWRNGFLVRKEKLHLHRPKCQKKKREKKRRSRGTASIYSYYSLFFSAETEVWRRPSAGETLFYINASVTPNWKWIGHIPRGCHLRGRGTLIHMSHSSWRTKSRSRAKVSHDSQILPSVVWTFQDRSRVVLFCHATRTASRTKSPSSLPAAACSFLTVGDWNATHGDDRPKFAWHFHNTFGSNWDLRWERKI